MLEQLQEQQPPQDYFAMKRIELVVEMANKKVLAEVQQLRQELQRMDSEVAELRKRASNGYVSIQQPAQMQPQAQQQPRPMNDFSAEKKVSADVPRYGHYTSNDVSVEKFFNFGRKK